MSAVQAHVTPIAPSHPGRQGHATRGGHHIDYINQPVFELGATVKLVTTAIRWRENTNGFKFYMATLAKNPGTIGKVLELGKAAGFTARMCQGDLRWFYTWAGDLEVNGKVFMATEPRGKAKSEPKAEKPAKAPKAKVSA